MPRLDKTKDVRWLCRCECGTKREVIGGTLKNGRSKSCGCLHAAIMRKHGQFGSPEYHAWAGLNSRCSSPTNNHYDNYGGRGITVCKRWRESFENFYADMGPRPSKKHSLDRIDNNGPYAPENCRWATEKEQQRNSRNNVMLTYDGETLCAAEWAERFNMNRHILYNRLHAGWSIERALTQPVRKIKC